MEEYRGMRLRKPCDNCPFRTDVDRFLHPKRYLSIARSMVDMGESFTCHKHNQFDDETGKAITNAESMSCAGGMIWLQHQKKPNTLMQVMQRFGLFNPSKLRMDSPVYRTRREFEQGIEETTKG